MTKTQSAVRAGGPKNGMRLLIGRVALTIFAAAAGKAQVSVAAQDIGTGIGRAGWDVAKGTIHAGTGIAVATCGAVASSVTVGVVGGVALTAATLAYHVAGTGLEAGILMAPPVASAAKDLSFGFVKAGWHLAFPARGGQWQAEEDIMQVESPREKPHHFADRRAR